MGYIVTEKAMWPASPERRCFYCSWCAGNALDELAELATPSGCLCGLAHFEHLADTSGPFLDEEGEGKAKVKKAKE